MLRISCWIIFIVIAAAGLAAEPELDETPPPANPAQFHEQEWERVSRSMAAFGEAPITETQQDFDARYYHLTVDVRAFSARVIYGSVRIIGTSQISAFDELVLDLCFNLTVDSAVFGGHPCAVTRNGNLMTVALGDVYGVGENFDGTIYYHGTPCQTNYYPSWIWYNRSVGPILVPSIATLSEPYGARDWWPSKNLPEDKADSARISIIVADTLTATSNGVLESVTTLPPSSRMFTWFEKHPIATYLISLNATNYTSFNQWYVAQNGDSVPIVHYPYPERLNAAQISWSGVPVMMEFLAGQFGEYPFADEKYGHTMFNINGGMEHQCNTSYGRGITNGQHTYDYIVVHELGHQWYGDAVTLETWPDVWLNEGFAAYVEALWTEHVSGFAAYHDYMMNPANNGVTDPSGPLYNPNYLFDANTVYNKGSWILHMLRGVVRNDSLFFAMMREYLQRHDYSTATTEEFLSDMTDAAGFDVASYLHAYLYLTNRPIYRVSFGSGTLDGELRTAVRIRQVQTDPDTTFRTRLDLAFSGASDTSVYVIDSNWQEEYFYSFGWAPESLQVDPGDWVLKELEMEPLPPTILNTSVSPALATVAYADTLVAIGGQTPYAWSVIGGQLPSGISLSDDGRLTGATGEMGVFAFTARVEGAVAGTDTVTLILSVANPLVAPDRLTVYRADVNHVHLRWRAVAYATGYYVYRATQADLSDAQLIVVTPNNKATDAVTPPGEPGLIEHWFYYVVAARDWP